ncbi:alpha/beta fold hydrolase [bacterium]|nr:alpha/beta fold hydrolase [bacterium]
MTGLITRLGLRLDAGRSASRKRAFREGWPASASPGVSFHTTDKVQFRYREAGAGRTIVLTADPPMTLETYDALIERFSTAFRVIVVELPAMGFTAVSRDYAFGFRETNEELAAFLREVAGEGAILAFSCVAGLAAVDIAARHPELCSHLALIQTGDVAAFSLWKARRDPKRILARPIVGQLVLRRLAPKRMPDWYALSVGRREMIPSLCTCAAESFRHGAQWSLASAYQVYMDERLKLAAPRQPVLSIWGEADRSHPEDNRHTIRRLAPSAGCRSLPGLGHTPELEDPASVFALIREFVGEG